jgi:outer membrane protein
MKKIITGVCVILTFASVQALAQFNQGRWLANGTVGFSFQKNSTYNASTDGTSTSTSRGLNLTPTVGYFIIDNLAAGLILDLSTSRLNYDTFNPLTGLVEEASSGLSSVSAGPFVRYYLPMSVFFQGSATFGTQKYSNENSSGDSESIYRMRRYSLSVGYAWFLNDYVALEPSIGYQNDVLKDKEGDYKTTTGSLALRAALAIYLGERK